MELYYDERKMKITRWWQKIDLRDDVLVHFYKLLLIQYYGYSLLIKADFAGANRKPRGWNIICSLLIISIFQYLQIQSAEILFSAHHQGVDDIFALNSITVTSFSDCQKHKDIAVKTLQWDEKMKTLHCLHFLSITYGIMTYASIIVWY